MSTTESASETESNVKSEESSQESSENSSVVTADDATAFIVRCKEFLEKERRKSQDSDGSSESGTYIDRLTPEDIGLVHKKLFNAWRAKKTEFAMTPEFNVPKTWPPRRLQGLESEDTVASFEDARSKIDAVSTSQIKSRPVSPDILELLDKEIDVFENLAVCKAAPVPPCVKAAEKEPKSLEVEKHTPELVPKSESLPDMSKQGILMIAPRGNSMLSVLKRTGSLDLSIRLYEWCEEDLKRRSELKGEQTPVNPSPSKIVAEMALSTSRQRLSKRKDFSCWLLTQAKKLYDILVSERGTESDDTSRTESTGSTSDGLSGGGPIMLPPASEARSSNTQFGLSEVSTSTDTLSGITSIATDSMPHQIGIAPQMQVQAPQLVVVVAPQMQAQETPTLSSESTTTDSAPRRQRSPNDTVSSPKRQTL